MSGQLLTKGIYFKDNPILVRVKGEGFEIIDGEHRWKVAKELNFSKIWCTIREATDEEAMELCVIKNKDRGTINYLKLSKLLNVHYEPYSRENGNNQKELGAKFGYSRQSIGEILPIYSQLKSADASALLRFSNRQLMFLARIRNDTLRHYIVKRTAEKNLSGKAPTAHTLSYSHGTGEKNGLHGAWNPRRLRRDVEPASACFHCARTLWTLGEEVLRVQALSSLLPLARVCILPKQWGAPGIAICHGCLLPRGLREVLGREP